MKGEFAKLFEIDGRQVLVHADNNDEGAPSICVSLQCSVGRADLFFSFSDDEEGCDARDERMALVLEGDTRYAEAALNQVAGFLSEEEE